MGTAVYKYRLLDSNHSSVLLKTGGGLKPELVDRNFVPYHPSGSDMIGLLLLYKNQGEVLHYKDRDHLTLLALPPSTNRIMEFNIRDSRLLKLDWERFQKFNNYNCTALPGEVSGAYAVIGRLLDSHKKPVLDLLKAVDTEHVFGLNDDSDA